MATVRRQVRKVPGSARAFDDLNWPVDVALIALGAFLVGIALSFLRFDDPVPWRNAWTSVIGVPIAVGAGMYLSRSVNRVWLKRSMQFGLLISLLVHTIILLGLLEVKFRAKEVAERKDQSVREEREERERLAVAFDLMHVEAPRTEIDRPVAADVPPPQMELVERRETDQSSIELQPQPVETPEDTVRPNIVKNRAVYESVPRRSETTSRFSRNNEAMQQAVAQAAEIAPSPANAAVAETRRDAQPQPSSVAVTRPSDAADAPQSLPEPSIAIDAPAIQRATVDEAPALAAQSPLTVRRDESLARIAPSLDARQLAQAATEQPRDPALTPQDTDVARRAPSGSVAPVQRQDAFVEAAELSPRIERRENDLDNRPSVAATAQPLPTRAARLTERPTQELLPQAADAADAAAELAATPLEQPATSESVAAAPTAVGRQQAVATDPAVPQVSAAPEPSTAAVEAPRRAAADAAQPAAEIALPLAMDRQLNAEPQSADASLDEVVSPSRSPVANAGGLRPTESTVARQAATAATEASRQPADTPASAPTTTIARTASQRLLASSEPTLNALERPTDQPARAATLAEAAVSPVAVASPASQVTSEQSPAVAPPAAMALSRGSTGTAGSGYSPNLDRQAPAAESPALAASGSSRDRATQTSDDGPALAPVARAQIARSYADQLRPSAAIEASGGLAGPVPAGEARTGPAASASAAPIELAAQAERGSVSADRGSLEVDIGPQRIVAQFQDGRGSGGGSELLNLVPQTGSVSRPQRSGAAEIAIEVDSVAEAAAAPAGDGGSRPLAIDASPLATAGQRLDPGGESANSGSPAVALTEGPVSEPNSADMAGPLAARTARSRGADEPSSAAAGDSTVSQGPHSPERQSLAGSSPDQIVASAVPSDVPSEPIPSGTTADDGSELAPSASAVAIDSPRSTARLGSLTTTDAAQAGSAVEPQDVAATAIGSTAGARRSEAVDAPVGAAAVGGGQGSIQRQAQGPAITLDTSGLAALSPSNVIGETGTADNTEPAAAGLAIARQPGGISAGSVQPEGETSAVIDTGTLGTLRPGGGTSGNASILAQPSRIRAATSDRAEIARNIVPSTAEPAGPSGLTPSEIRAEYGALEAGAVSGPRTSGLAVSTPANIDAPEGSGGLAAIPALDVGINDRRARRDSEQVQSRVTRLPRQEIGGRPQMNPAAVMAADAFRKRIERTGPGGGTVQLGPETERAIELGLVFLARHQHEDGRWSLQGFDREKPSIQSDAAATALALLAFQGAGYTHMEHQYADVVRKAIDFLIANQNADGLIFAPADTESSLYAKLYTHAIGALALCEAYGMTQDPSLREPAQSAIDYIVGTQNKELGGWRYAPQVSSDTSVTGWMMMAMKSGELAGLSVPQKAYDGILNWLDMAQASDRDPHLYRYNPFAEDNAQQRHGRRPSRTMTSVGLLMRLYSGWRRDNANMKRGAEYLRQHLPALGATNETLLERQRDTYYWYYGTQVMFHMGGDSWRDWNARLHPLLVDSQIPDGQMAGSWDPLNPVPDRWAGHGGRLYVTTMNLLSLEVSYRHLPLYEDTAR